MHERRWRRWGTLGVAALAVLLAGCGASQAGGSASPAKVASRGTPEFKDPVYNHNFPDPFVLKAGAWYYAYATNSANVEIPTMRSTDLVHWKTVGDAMPVPPRWVSADIWAPAVLHRSDGKYVLYFAARDMSSGHECLGYAVGSRPAGPFKSTAAKPWVCQASLGGDIDPDVFRDGKGRLYLLWKNDGNCCGVTTWLWSQRLAANGTTLAGKPVKLDYDHAAWEGDLIEAPFMWQHGSTYYLFYSANSYASTSYAVGYATCRTPSGPCKDAPNNPILTSKCQAAGPGGETIVTDAHGQTWMLYHAWSAGAVGDDTAGRKLWLSRLTWQGAKPVVHGPICTKQPAPAT